VHGDSVTLNCTNLGSNYSVQWYRTNVSIENSTTYTQVVKQPGTYKVVTKNLSTGCSRISSSSAIVAVSCRLANPNVVTADITESDFAAKGINEEPKGKIYIYPNPTSDNKFTVELMGLEIDGNATLEVYNAMGQVLFSEKVNITNGTLNHTIQIDEQSKGQLCLVRLIAGSEMYDSKVILK
jgi:Secretion system C-terminal sorting domain